VSYLGAARCLEERARWWWVALLLECYVWVECGAICIKLVIDSYFKPNARYNHPKSKQAFTTERKTTDCMAHRMEWRQKRMRRKLPFIFVCNFCYNNLQIRKLFSKLSKRFVHKYPWVFTQDVGFCCRTATTAEAQLRNTKCCAGSPWQPGLNCKLAVSSFTGNDRIGFTTFGGRYCLLLHHKIPEDGGRKWLPAQRVHSAHTAVNRCTYGRQVVSEISVFTLSANTTFRPPYIHRLLHVSALSGHHQVDRYDMQQMLQQLCSHWQ